MNVVYAQLAEYVLAVGIDRMEAGKALLGYFFRRHSQRYVFQNLSLGLGEVDFLLLLLSALSSTVRVSNPSILLIT